MIVDLGAYRMYVRAMPQGEAQTALIALGQYLAEIATQSRFDYIRVCKTCGCEAGPDHACVPDLPPAQQALIERQCEDCED